MLQLPPELIRMIFNEVDGLRDAVYLCIAHEYLGTIGEREVYARSLSKPGFLRAMLGYFGAAFDDKQYFQSRLNTSGKLQMPVLGMGGERC